MIISLLCCQELYDTKNVWIKNVTEVFIDVKILNCQGNDSFPFIWSKAYNHMDTTQVTFLLAVMIPLCSMSMKDQ